jgi:peptide-methionine (S)-S-oxide reductase
MKKATFAAGCFWHVEEVFSNTKGVTSTQVGYTGGNTKNPTYEQVCTDTTGHAEAIEVQYDPNEISYEELVNVFFNNHNPTTPNQQGPDIGIQYRSSIFYHDTKQENIAKQSKEKLNSIAKEKFGQNIVTEIKPADKFYRAEDYHQKYFQKH